MANAVEVAYRDFGAERVVTGIPTDAGATGTEKGTLVTEMNKWSIGQPAGADNVTEIAADSGTGATSPAAKSAEYAYFMMKDNVNGRTYKERLPMPNPIKAVDAGLNVAWLAVSDSSGNSVQKANPAHADYATLKAAIEAIYLSPEGNTGTLTEIVVPNKY